MIRPLDKGTLRNLFVEVLSDARQHPRVDHCQLAVGEVEHAHAPQLRQRFVGVNEGKTERIRDMLLREREFHRVIDNETQEFGAFVEADDEGGDAFRGVAAANAGEAFVNAAFFARAKPRHVECQVRHLSKQGPDFAARQQAKLDVGQSFNAVAGRFKHCRLQTEEVAGKMEIQNLASSVRQSFEADGPAGIQSIELRAIVACVDDLAPGAETEMLPL